MPPLSITGKSIGYAAPGRCGIVFSPHRHFGEQANCARLSNRDLKPPHLPSMNKLFTTRILPASLLLLLPTAIDAASEPREIPLWPGGAPGSEGKADQEIVQRGTNGERSV